MAIPTKIFFLHIDLHVSSVDADIVENEKVLVTQGVIAKPKSSGKLKRKRIGIGKIIISEPLFVQ
jgi:hypothetical protein